MRERWMQLYHRRWYVTVCEFTLLAGLLLFSKEKLLQICFEVILCEIPDSVLLFLCTVQARTGTLYRSVIAKVCY